MLKNIFVNVFPLLIYSLQNYMNFNNLRKSYLRNKPNTEITFFTLSIET